MSAFTKDEGEPIAEEDLEQFVSDVRTCLSRREMIESYLTNVYSRRLQEEEGELQEELNSFFAEETEFAWICLISVSTSVSLSASLTQAAEENIVSDNTIEEFSSFWSNISWVKEAAHAFYLYDTLGVSYWTDKSIEFDSVESRLIVNHTMMWGFSKVHELTVPVEAFVDDTGDRLEEVTSWLESQSEDESPPDELVEALEDDAERIAELTDRLTAALDE